MAVRAEKGGGPGPSRTRAQPERCPRCARGELGVSVVPRGPLLITAVTRLRSLPGS